MGSCSESKLPMGELEFTFLGKSMALTEPDLPTSKWSQDQVVHNLPPGSTPVFVGREGELIRLHDCMQTGQPAAVAVTGGDGIGKTELVLQYAYRFGPADYQHICWLHGSDREIASQIVNFTRTYLGLNPPTGLPLDRQMQWCWQHWPVSSSLIIYDDVADLSHIESYLPPQSDRWRALMTTPVQPENTATIAPLTLTGLSQEAALAVLRYWAGAERINQQLAAARVLCDQLSGVPLGLDLVGRYLACQPQLSMAALQQRLDAKNGAVKDWIHTLGRHPLPPVPLILAAVFSLSFDQLNRDEQRLAELLSLFAPGSIPWEVVQACWADVDTRRLTSWRDCGLLPWGLLRRVSNQADCYQLHPLVRLFLGAQLRQADWAEDLKRDYCGAIVEITRPMKEDFIRSNLSDLVSLIPHIKEAAVTWQDSLEGEEEALLCPFVAVGRYYTGQGAYGAAELWWQTCLTITKNRFGQEHPAFAASLSSLADLYRFQELYYKAEPLYQEALGLRKRRLGDRHPDIANSLNNLGIVYHRQGRHDQAEPLFQEALALVKQVLGSDHPDVATSLNNLALVSESQQRYQAAESLHQEALALRRQLFGNEHIDVAASLDHLGSLYQTLGRLDKAEPLYKEALELRRQILGEAHQDVATSLNNLGGLYQWVGRHDEAVPLFRQSLTLRQQLFGDDHPDVAVSLNNLAGSYQAIGHISEAESLFQAALVLRQKLMGNSHSDVATSLNNLALLYDSQGRYGEAAPLYEEALAIRRELFGTEHPDVAASLNNLAVLYANQELFHRAEPLMEEALCLWERLLGPEHHYTLSARFSLEVLRDLMTS
ncbi:tetratricopeptide repeat protein [filamentous cyanobacterium CCP5]|nr:tetratricopeptide repeat protein [filamentous cyanobacterium CCP5]